MRSVASLALATVFVACAGCGRTSVVGLTNPAPVEIEEPIDEAPWAIYVRDNGAQCPRTGTKGDLEPQSGERVVVADLRFLGECSGAGGHWIIGRLENENRDTMLGGHACYFLDPDAPEDPKPEAPSSFGVVWMQHAAVLFEGPSGWCITDTDGNEPVFSDVQLRAVALYSSKAAAEAAAKMWME